MSRASLANAVAKVENFQQTFPRAKSMQSKAGLACAISGIAQYFLDKSHPGACYFLGSGLCMLALFPWTKIVIMPINYALMSPEALKKNDEWINEKIDKWGQVHFVRVILGGIAFALNIKAILLM